MINELKSKDKKLAVIGLGYVGLPIALEFAKKLKVVGFDINQSRVDLMKQGIDPSGELEKEAFEGTDILFSADPEDLKDVTFFVVAVPTPIDQHNLPNLKPLLGATRTVAGALKKGDCVVFESTVYPGCTEDDCVPLMEEVSGLKYIDDFKVGYSPERINPGDKEHTITKITKVASGCDDESAQLIKEVYELIITAGVYLASSIKVAEAAKIIENTQRDLNIALMNELSLIFDKMNINTFEVLEAAGTKWNFLKFFPGLVGGHCIGVDPYYLTYKAQEIGHNPRVILSGRQINDGMGAYVAKRTIQEMAKLGKDLSQSKVLLMGATFKENVEDIRNSKVVDVYNELISFGLNVDIVDPHANKDELKEEYGMELSEKIGSDYDAVIVAVNHNEYQRMSEADFQKICKDKAAFIDVKGIFKGKIQSFQYWSL